MIGFVTLITKTQCPEDSHDCERQGLLLLDLDRRAYLAVE